MIETLYGKIFDVDRENGTLIIEAGGVGYAVTVNAGTIAALPPAEFSPDGTRLEGENVRIFTHMSVREDGVELFGFCTRDEIAMFRMLIGVSGIGPKAAMSILSIMTPRSLANAIELDDSKSIARAPGVGPKTAARVTLELKDKIRKAFPTLAFADNSPSVSSPARAEESAKISDTRDALTALGYSRSEIAAAMKDIDLTEDVEEIIRQALAVLMKG